MTHITCADLRRLVEPHPDRVALLILLRDVPGKPHGEIGFVTYGRKAADKVEAHNLKEWVKNEVFNGEVPQPARVHESFIHDAALNSERLDTVKTLVREMRQYILYHGLLIGECVAWSKLKQLVGEE